MKKKAFTTKTVSMLVLCALLSTSSAPLLNSSYATSVTLSQKQVVLTDIKGHWAAKFITKLVSEQSIAGYPDGSYRPNKTITNAELASIIAGAVKLHPKDKEGHWASGVFGALYDKGISANDYPKSQWDQPISRYQMIKLLILVNENIQSHPSVEASDAKAAIADYADIPKSYQYYVEQAVKKGFIRGDQNQRINGTSTTTRAEAAVIIDKLKTAQPGQTVTPTPVPQQSPQPQQPTQPQASKDGYAPKPAGYDQLPRKDKFKARANKKIGWIYYDAEGFVDETKLTPLQKSDHQPSEEAYRMGLKMAALLNPDVDVNKWKNDNSHSLMTWDKAQQSFALTIIKEVPEDTSYAIRAYSNSTFKIEQMGMIGSDGKGGMFKHDSLGFTAKIDPAKRDDGFAHDPNYPVIRNNKDNPEYIILLGVYRDKPMDEKIFIIPTKGLPGILWENESGYAADAK